MILGLEIAFLTEMALKTYNLVGIFDRQSSAMHELVIYLAVLIFVEFLRANHNDLIGEYGP